MTKPKNDLVAVGVAASATTTAIVSDDGAGHDDDDQDSDNNTDDNDDNNDDVDDDDTDDDTESSDTRSTWHQSEGGGTTPSITSGGPYHASQAKSCQPGSTAGIRTINTEHPESYDHSVWDVRRSRQLRDRLESDQSDPESTVHTMRMSAPPPITTRVKTEISASSQSLFLHQHSTVRYVDAEHDFRLHSVQRSIPCFRYKVVLTFRLSVGSLTLYFFSCRTLVEHVLCFLYSLC